MRVEDVQREMRILADQLGCDRLRELADALYRRPKKTSAPPTSNPMTPRLRDYIIHLHETYPDWSQQKIATHLGINAGRVSEVLAGKRK